MVKKEIIEVLKKISENKDLVQRFQSLKGDQDGAYELALSISDKKFTKQEFLDGVAELKKAEAESVRKPNGELTDEALKQASGGYNLFNFLADLTGW